MRICSRISVLAYNGIFRCQLWLWAKWANDIWRRLTYESGKSGVDALADQILVISAPEIDNSIRLHLKDACCQRGDKFPIV